MPLNLVVTTLKAKVDSLWVPNLVWIQNHGELIKIGPANVGHKGRSRVPERVS